MTADAVTAVLQQALDDAATLLAHAHRNGIDVDAADRQAVLDYAAKVKADTPTTAADQAELLRAQGALAKKLSPVTVDGIRSTDYGSLTTYRFIPRVLNVITFGRWPYTGSKPALAFRIVTWNSIGAVFVILLTILLIVAINRQITGFTLMKDSVAKHTAITKESASIDENIRLKKAQLEQIDPKLDAAIEKEDAVEVAKQTLAAETLSTEIRALNAQKAELSTEVENAITSYNVAAARLQKSNWSAGIIDLVKSAIGLGSAEPTAAQVAEQTAKGITFERMLNLLLTVKEDLVWQLGFALPALAALLACLISTLRGMAREIAGDIYTEASRIQYKVKLILAPLCGIVIGLLAVGDIAPIAGQSLNRLTSDVMATDITPATITLQFTAGFVIGYGLELFFAIVDRFVASTQPRA